MSKVKATIILDGKPITHSFKVMFDNYTCPDDYLADGVVPIEPMTAKEIMDKDIDKVFSSSDYVVEEKIDGVRANVQFFAQNSHGYCRVFSRRKSVLTGFYGEKTDNLPQIRDIDIPELAGTILDGELVIPNSDFKTTSAVLNCLPAEAIERQISDGQVVFNVFDCLYFKGKNIMNLPLKTRKAYLTEVMSAFEYHGISSIKEVYSHEAREVGLKFYQQIVENGGEGIMIKDKNAPYEMSRTRAYQKLKKKLTRDVVIVGFTRPTKEYTGKFPNDKWEYWVDSNDQPIGVQGRGAREMIDEGYIPVTKNFYYGKVGAIEYGVLASKQMLSVRIKSVNSYCKNWFNGKVIEFADVGDDVYVKVGECEGMTDLEREEFTRNKFEYIGKVIEVECNEIFKDTGKMRHPRFIRVREDKSAKDCTWEAHINI